LQNADAPLATRFSISVTALEPGQMRTDWAGRSMHRAARSIEDYDAVFEPSRAARAAKSGNQPGDPAKAGLALIKLIESEAPPAHLLLGPDTYEFVHKDLRIESAKWVPFARQCLAQTDFRLRPAG
jgi:hypothetical protein